jgi:preprotein translocase subunit Sec63
LKPRPDYYAILGAGEDASRREIAQLYKRQAHKRHPDRGGAEEDMKALNEAYEVLHNEKSRHEYDSVRRRPDIAKVTVHAAPAAREVGVYGQFLSALLCMILGLLLLFLVRFNGLWFLWPLSILATGVILFGIVMAHSAMTNARESLAASHPVRRLRVVQEIVFWFIVGCGGYGVYLILTTI